MLHPHLLHHPVADRLHIPCQRVLFDHRVEQAEVAGAGGLGTVAGVVEGFPRLGAGVGEVAFGGEGGEAFQDFVQERVDVRSAQALGDDVGGDLDRAFKFAAGGVGVGDIRVDAAGEGEEGFLGQAARLRGGAEGGDHRLEFGEVGMGRRMLARVWRWKSGLPSFAR